jgi:hypothetical protein
VHLFICGRDGASLMNDKGSNKQQELEHTFCFLLSFSFFLNLLSLIIAFNPFYFAFNYLNILAF